jgi:hypothetical protein
MKADDLLTLGPRLALRSAKRRPVPCRDWGLTGHVMLIVSLSSLTPQWSFGSDLECDPLRTTQVQKVLNLIAAFLIPPGAGPMAPVPTQCM